MDGNFADVLAEALAGALGDHSRFKCAPFKGGKDENIESFFDKYDMWCETNGKNEAYKIENFSNEINFFERHSNFPITKLLGKENVIKVFFRPSLEENC